MGVMVMPNSWSHKMVSEATHSLGMTFFFFLGIGNMCMWL